MPVLNLPNKICKCCGNTTWYVNHRTTTVKGKAYSGPGYICHACAKRRKEVLYAKQGFIYKQRQIQKVGLETWKKYVAENNLNYRKRQQATPELKKAFLQGKKEQQAKAAVELHDHYVKKVIIVNTPGLKNSDISFDLINTKRKSLHLQRQLKQLQNENKNQTYIQS